jgi:hypothetical protein
MADLGSTLMQQVFDVSQRLREPEIEHHGHADDLGTGLEKPEGGGLGPCGRLSARLANFSLSSSDTVRQNVPRALTGDTPLSPSGAAAAPGEEPSFSGN